MRKFGWAGLAALICGGVATSAFITSLTFGGDLSDYQAAPACVAGQHASSTSCRETLQTTVVSKASSSPCQVSFKNVSTTTNIDCGNVWQALSNGSTATLVLWHDDAVSVADQAGLQQTTSYPQSTGPLFFAASLVLAVIALLLTALWWLGKRTVPRGAPLNSNAS
jgi:hypothetical protein